MITSEFKDLLVDFDTMVRDKKIHGLGALKHMKWENCPICFNPIKSRNLMTAFKCKKH